jgi:5'-nucleotidase
MKILVSNDDGINAPGLKALVLALATEHEVTVMAPDRERSACGHSVTMDRPLQLRAVEYSGGVRAYSVNGTPADCVKLGLDALPNAGFDLVVSGINSGPNLGTDVLYSGTVSAAVEAAIFEVPALAVSALEWNNQDNFAQAAEWALKALRRLRLAEVPPMMLFNLNVPLNASKMRVCRLGVRRYVKSFLSGKDPWGGDFYWMAGEVKADTNGEDTDIWATEHGMAALTPVQIDLTAYDYLAKMKDWTV